MSTTRTSCTECGFEVAARPDCPLCGHPLADPSSPTSLLGTLFGD